MFMTPEEVEAEEAADKAIVRTEEKVAQHLLSVRFQFVSIFV